MPEPVAIEPATSDYVHAYVHTKGSTFTATAYTRGPWNPAHQHAGPPMALVCRSMDLAAGEHGLTHLARLTCNLLRPIPIDELTVQVSADYIGKSVGHISAQLVVGGKEVARCTALFQREVATVLPTVLPGHPLPLADAPPEASTPAQFPFADGKPGYAELVSIRHARGENFQGPCAVWFRMNHSLVLGEAVGAYQRVVVAADSGNGISAVLDYRRHQFVNADLTINLLRRPVGEWICLDAHSALGDSGGGIAQSRLFDVQGLIGYAAQSLNVRLGV